MSVLAAAVGSGSGNGYIFISTDTGSSWTQTGTDQQWAAIVSSSDGSNFAAAVFNGYIFLGSFLSSPSSQLTFAPSSTQSSAIQSSFQPTTLQSSLPSSVSTFSPTISVSSTFEQYGFLSASILFFLWYGRVIYIKWHGRVNKLLRQRHNYETIAGVASVEASSVYS